MDHTSRSKAEAVAWYQRYRDFKFKFAIGAGIVAIVVALVLGLGKRMLSIDRGKGAPIGYAVRTDAHIGVLIQTLDAYIPSPNRDRSKDTYSIGLFIVPLDGSEPRLVPIKQGLSPNSFSLAKIIGSDGRALWYDVAGTGAVDLKTFEPLQPSELREPPQMQRSSSMALGPKVEHHLAAGLFTSPTSWLGLYSAAEAGRDLKEGFSLKRVVPAVSAKQLRRFHQVEVEAEVMAGRQRIISARPLGGTDFLNAAFVRMEESSEPLRMHDPDGALMIHTDKPGLGGKLVVARVDDNGSVVWSVDTGLDRFALQQILPGKDATVFIGTRLPVPDRVSEPLLVIVEHATGKVSSRSLWR
jgi:hypothetical protein